MQARFLICEITQVECANNSDTANTAKWSVTSKPVVRQYVPGQHTIILEGVQVNEVSMKTGIPMHIPEPDNDYTSYKEARLYFGGPHADDDAQKFQDELNVLEADWQSRCVQKAKMSVQ